jgi:hypothetical protein
MAILNALLSVEDLGQLSGDQREFLVQRLDTAIQKELRTPGTAAHNALAGELKRALGAIGKASVKIHA